MKKRTAFISAILSLISFGQPLIIRTGVVLSSTGFIFSLSEKVNAETAKFYFDRGFQKGEQGDYYGAISDFTKAIEINPADSVSFYNRGWNLGSLKDYYGAISDYNKALEIDPRYSKAFKNRSISKESIGDIKGACLDAKQAVSLGDTASDNQTWIKKNC